MARKSARPKHRRKPAANPFVLAPRTMKRGEKVMLADFVKTLPMTADPAQAKKFTGRQGAHRFLQRHPALKKRLRYAPLSAVAAD